MRRYLAALLIIAGIISIGGCGDRSRRDTARNSTGPRKPQPGEALTLTMDGAPATAFRTSLREDGASPLKRKIEGCFPSITVDPRLSTAAEAYAKGAESSAVELPPSFTDFVVHWAGCPDPSAAVSTLLTDADGDDVVVEHLQKIIADGDFTHLGLARVASHDYHWRWQIILVTRACTLKAVPSSVAPGTSIPIMFKVDPRFTSATIYATQPRGKINAVPAGMSDTWAVASVVAGYDIGELWIELLAEGDKGPEVLALFPIEIGRSPSRIWVGTADADESWIKDPTQAVDYMVSLINRDRAADNLPTLTLDPQLSAIARAHSVDMAQSHFFAHISPSTGDISDRLRRQGYLATIAMENLARSETLNEAEDGLMRSPGHRAALLSDEVTHLGVGVVRATSDPPMYIVTQIFAKPFVASTPANFLSEFETRIRERRNTLGLTTRIDSRLQRAAQAIAERLTTADIEQGRLKQNVEPELERAGLANISWRVAAGAASTIDDVDLPRCIDASDMTTFGLGATPRQSANVPSITFVVLVME